MNKEIREAMLKQIEARQALNALKKDAKPEDRSSAIETLNKADQAVADLLAKFEEPKTAPIELRNKIKLAKYLHAFGNEKLTDGPEQELRQELKLSDNALPLEALLNIEDRADQVSPQTSDTSKNDQLASGAINRTTGPMLNRVFKQTDSAFLGVQMPTVPAGERRYPVMTAGTTAAMVARGAQQDAGPARFDVVDATPHRLSARYVFDLEGVAELGGMLESTLRSDLRMAMGYQLDLQILNGTGKNNQVTGLLNQFDLDLQPGATFSTNDANKVIDWALSKQLGYGSLDGIYSRTESDLRMLIGQATYNIMRGVYRTTTSDDQDGVDVLRSQGVSISESFQIPAPAVATFNGKSAASTKKVQKLLVNSEPMAAVAPVWQGITMIRDPYTNAGKGQIVITANMLFDLVMRRKDGWKLYGIRTET